MDKRPNILMIVTDQLRYDCLGYAGKYPVKTPNIDKIASEGMWFSNAYTNIPTCCPARQSLLSGRRSEDFGALWNYDITLKIPALEPTAYTWTKELQENKYNMSYIGKWHVHPEYTPLDYGFDYYYSEEDYWEYRDKKFPNNLLNMNWQGETDKIDVEYSKTHILAKKTYEKIKEYSVRDKPWHIRLDFSEPHLPCMPSKKFADMYKSENIVEWGSFKDDLHNKPYIQKQMLVNWEVEDKNWDYWSEIVARYYATITQLDDAVGLVIKKLEEFGQTDNTIVIFTSDHGDMCGGHRMVDKHYVMYEDIVKVPLVIKWPNVVKENSICDKHVYNLLDIAPTILEAVGLEEKPFFHGESLINLLNGNDNFNWREEVVASYNGQQFGLYCQRMIKNKDYKYIWNLTDIDELYDMNNDPNELENLISNFEYNEVVSNMRKKLFGILKKDGDDILKTHYVEKQLLENRKL